MVPQFWKYVAGFVLPAYPGVIARERAAVGGPRPRRRREPAMLIVWIVIAAVVVFGVFRMRMHRDRAAR